ncbi:MAG: hypothetical protein KIT25_06260 [Enhydrobacter sp.]|nr:MAG: hypothetical protein KIT25_06260 [Enhydrobacter sp.]
MRFRFLAAGTVATLVLFSAAACEHARVPARADLEYCGTLVDLYVRYVGPWDLGPRQLAQRTDIEGQLAVEQCRAGDAVTSIPVLERKLLDQGFTLPPRP